MKIFSYISSSVQKGLRFSDTLLRLAGDWKREFDNHRYVGAVLMDLSKDFDCLPHDFIIDKPAAYGLSAAACSFLQSYISDCLQMVKLGQNHSSWLKIIKGVPQG